MKGVGSKMKIIGLVIVIVVLAAAGYWAVNSEIFAKYDKPGSRVVVKTADKEKGIVGFYRGKKGKIQFSATHKSTTDEEKRIVLFQDKKKKITAQMIIDDAEGTNSFEVAGVRWSPDALGVYEFSEEEKKKLQEFGKTELARAIIEVAAYAHWKAPGQKTTMHRVSFIQFYDGIAQFFSPENLKLIQPLNAPVPDTCFLKKGCELISNDAVFNCGDEKAMRYVLPLIDGLPSECRLEK